MEWNCHFHGLVQRALRVTGDINRGSNFRAICGEVIVRVLRQRILAAGSTRLLLYATYQLMILPRPALVIWASYNFHRSEQHRRLLVMEAADWFCLLTGRGAVSFAARRASVDVDS